MNLPRAPQHREAPAPTEREVAARITFERTIAEIAARMARSQGSAIDAEIRSSLATLGAFFGVDRSYVFLIDHERRDMSNSHEWAAAGVSPEAANLQNVPLDTFPWLLARLQADEDVHVPDVSQLPPAAAAERAEFEREQIQSILIVPMRHGERLVGFVGFDAVQRRLSWTEEYVVGLRLIAQVFAATIEAAALELQLRRLAFQDRLTGLPNRVWLERHLDEAIRASRLLGTEVVLLMIDLDDFSLVNARYGHRAGDSVLRDVAGRLRTVAEPRAALGRFGGDQFVMVLECSACEDTDAVLEGVLGRLTEPLEVGGDAILVHPSIGVARGGGGGLDRDELLRASEVAMYAAKAGGKNRHAVFDPSMEREGLHGPRLRFELLRAMEQDELRVYLQPRRCLSSGALLGAEALVRWQHPRLGLLLPRAFLPGAEQTASICQLDRWMLAHAAPWARSEGQRWTLSVNLSARALRDHREIDALFEAIDASGMPVDRLELEITENVLLEDLPGAVTCLERLKRHAPGLRIALDDFGRGYSSLSYLGRLPIDTLKLDRSFMAGLAQGVHRGIEIVASIIALAHNLGLRVVAEGIEHPQQAAVLTELGCDEGQGYLLGAPRPAAQLSTERMTKAQPS